MAIKNKKHISGALTTPTFALSMSSSGISNLEEDLIINGQTVSPTFRYEAKNATTGSWTSTVGENLTGAGSGGTVEKDVPFISDDKAVNGEGTRYWQSTSTQFAPITTEDIVVELIIKPKNVTSGIFGNISDGVFDGYNLALVTAAGNNVSVMFRGYEKDSDRQFYIYANVPSDQWHHIIMFIDRGGNGAFYLNGAAFSAATSAINTVTGSIEHTDRTFKLNADFGGTAMTSDLAYVAMWQKDDWLDTHLQADIAKERFYKLCGVYPEIAKGTALPESYTRATSAFLDKTDDSGVRTLFQVGSGYPRVCSRTDVSGSQMVGYLSEKSSTNLVPYSQDFDNAAWTKLRATVTANSVEAPDGTTTADTLVEDGTAATTHFIYHEFSATSDVSYLFSAWVKAANRNWVTFQTSTVFSAVGYTSFDLTNGIVGTSTNHDDAGIEDWGDGWFRCWIKDTAAITDTGSLLINAAEADNDTAFDGLSQDSLYVWGAQVEETDYPSSYIYTSGSTAARTGDILYYKGDDGNVANNQQGTITVDVLIPERPDTNANMYLVNINDGASGSDRISLVSRIDDSFYTTTAATGGNGGATSLVTQLNTNEIESLRVTWKTNELTTYVDGVQQGSPDTLVDIPDDLDRIDIGFYGSTFQPYCLISNIKIFKKPTLKE